MGPLIDRAAVDAMQKALEEIRNQGGKILCGGEVLSGDVFDAGTYVTPCICEIGPDAPIVKEETFAPILYMIRYDTLEKAIAYQNDVPQGLSSAILTRDLPEAETFLSHRGSDCGIANVNIGTSGAEIGGAFGGEKKPAEGGNPALTHGRLICAVRPAPLTGPKSFRWHREFVLMWTDKNRECQTYV